MKGYVTHIESTTMANSNFRTVLYTAPNSQLVVMSIPVGGQIGEEIHGHTDQFIRIEQGECSVILNGVAHTLCADDAVVIPQGTVHNVVNTGTVELKVYTLYSPPEHKDQTVHKTSADVAQEHFDGKTTE